ncbi:MAG: hypothetical protein J1F64_10285, partial [Oscillospiraceae bacterium]|nr:hypothetical protein [Oscillospiraceae bacterium]
KYDLVENKFKMFTYNNDKKNINYHSVNTDENKIMFIPANLQNNTSYVFDFSSEKFWEIQWYKDNVLIERTSNIVCDGEYVFIAEYNTDKVIKLNINTFEYEKMGFGNDVKISVLGLDDNNKLWFISNDNTLVNHDSENMYKIDTDKKINKEAFSGMIFANKKIICVPRFSRYIYIYDIINKSVDKFEFYEKNSYNSTASFFLGHVRNDKSIILLPWGLLKACKIDLENNKVEYFELEAKEENTLVHYYYLSYISKETKEINIKYFLKKISYDCPEKKGKDSEENIGRKILNLTY